MRTITLEKTNIDNCPKCSRNWDLYHVIDWDNQDIFKCQINNQNEGN